jgi:hypothetical protein
MANRDGGVPRLQPGDLLVGGNRAVRCETVQVCVVLTHALRLTVASAAMVRTVAPMTDRRRNSLLAAATLPAVSLLLVMLAGCGAGTGRSDGPSVRGDRPSVVGSDDAPAILDCSQAEVVSVMAGGGQVEASFEEVSVQAGTALRIVVDADKAVTLRAGGSTVEQLQLDAGVSAVCLSYQSPGTYAVVVDDVVPVRISVEG